MKVSFSLELGSQEALIGIGLGLLVAIIAALMSGRRGPNITRNVVQINGSPGANASIDQSKRTSVKVDANVSVNVGATTSAPTSSKASRTSAQSKGNGHHDDAMGIVVLALAAMAIGGFFYLRHFEMITLVSRTVCFAAATYALIGCAIDVYQRGLRFDQIQFGYLLAGLASGTAAGFLLQAQELVSLEMLQAATNSSQGALHFFLNRLTNAGRVFLMASLVSTAIICFVALAAILAILRALILSWSDASVRSWPTRIALGATEWVRPVPFSFLSIGGLGIVAYTLYVWVPKSLHS